MFSDDELRQLLYLASAELRARAKGKQPGVRLWLRGLVRHLEQEVALAHARQAGLVDHAFSEHDDWIDAHAAARIMGWSTRTMQRKAADLDGQKVAGRYVFRESTVLAYAEELTDG